MKLILKISALVFMANVLTTSAFADEKMNSDSPRFFIGLNAGLYTRADNQLYNNNVLFDYGAKVGLSLVDLGMANLGFAVTYDRNRRGVDFLTASSANETLNDVSAQILFLNIAGTGFYFGPTAGVTFVQDTVDIAAVDNLGTATSLSFKTQNFLTVGAVAGYDIFILNFLSISPELRYEHLFGDSKSNDLKLLANVAYHF